MGSPFQRGVSGGPMFGSPGSPSTFTAPFSSQNQTAPFGISNPTGFGQSPTFGTPTFGFGTQSPFGSSNSSSASAFGSPSTSQNIFGGTPVTQQAFGSPSFGSSAQFGIGQQGFGVTQPGFGTAAQNFNFGTALQAFGGGFGTNQSGFGSGQQSFGSPSQPFGSSQQAFGAAASGQPSFGTTQPSFGSVPSVFGNVQPSFSSPQSGFSQSFGTSQPFGTGQQIFGGSQGFGTTQQGFGSGQQGFGTTQQGFGSVTQGFGGTTGFGATTVGSQTNIGFSSPSFQFTAPSTASNTFQTNQAQPFGNPPLSSSGFGSTPAQQGFSFATVSTPFSFTSPTITTNVAFGSPSLSSAPKLVQSSLSNTFMSRPILKPTTTPAVGIPTTSKSAASLSGVVDAATVKVGKENLIPQELIDSITGFKNIVSDQKHYSSEISRASLQPIRKIAEDFETIKQVLTKLESNVISNNTVLKNIKTDTIRGLSDCEIAQSAVDVSGNFQANPDEKNEYFSQLCERFQDQVISLRLQVEDIEKHLTSVLNPSAFTPQELSRTLQRVHESFVALAGRMQLLHSSLLSKKKQQMQFFKKSNNWSNNSSNEGSRMRLGLNYNSIPEPSPLFLSGGISYYVLNLWARRAKQEQNLSNNEAQQQAFGSLPSFTASSSLGTAISEPPISSTGFPLKLPPSNKRWKR